MSVSFSLTRCLFWRVAPPIVLLYAISGAAGGAISSLLDLLGELPHLELVGDFIEGFFTLLPEIALFQLFLELKERDGESP